MTDKDEPNEREDMHGVDEREGSTASMASKFDFASMVTPSKLDFTSMMAPSKLDFTSMMALSKFDFTSMVTPSKFDFTSMVTPSKLDFTSMMAPSKLDFTSMMAPSKLDFTSMMAPSKFDFTSMVTPSKFDFTSVMAPSKLDFTSVMAPSKLDFTSITTQFASALTRDLMGTSGGLPGIDMARRADLLSSDALRRLIDAARAVQPRAGLTDGVLDSVARASVLKSPAPLAADGLLVDDSFVVAAWIRDITQQAMRASGLEDRDLKEDATAIYVYLLVASIVLTLLVNFPLPAVIAGMLGASAHQPALYASKMSRKAFRALNAPPDDGD